VTRWRTLTCAGGKAAHEASDDAAAGQRASGKRLREESAGAWRWPPERHRETRATRAAALQGERSDEWRLPRRVTWSGGRRAAGGGRRTCACGHLGDFLGHGNLCERAQRNGERAAVGRRTEGCGRSTADADAAESARARAWRTFRPLLAVARARDKAGRRYDAGAGPVLTQGVLGARTALRAMTELRALLFVLQLVVLTAVLDVLARLGPVAPARDQGRSGCLGWSRGCVWAWRAGRRHQTSLTTPGSLRSA